MNIYQEALDRLHIFSYFGDDGADSFHHKQHDEDIETLQELVDKETPKKPLPPKDTFFLHQCPNCKVDFIGSSIDRCQCGQKIDWSEDESK